MQVRNDVIITINHIINSSDTNSNCPIITFVPKSDKYSMLIKHKTPKINPITLPTKAIAIPSIKINENIFFLVKPRVLKIAKSYLRSLILFNKVNNIPMSDNDTINKLK
jgi:hypothetical protein